jgi:tRNA-dihydrouridine synthase B
MKRSATDATPSGKSLPHPILPAQPLTALAPMQDVTTRAFFEVIGRYGAPDYFFTEYFRVHATSRLEPHILESITGHGTGRPVFAQIIGEDIGHIERSIGDLLAYPVAGIDLNMGCPAPKIYKKNVGGGLLRDVPKVDSLLQAMRAAIPGLFSVKMRIGFEDTENFAALLDCVNRHGVDLLSVHGRTVKELYRSEVHYDWIRFAVERATPAVFANGNITSARTAAAVAHSTGAAGLMVGRGAIRNPWIFRQCRELFSGKPVYAPTLADVRHYVEDLWAANLRPHVEDQAQVNRMKKFMAFVGQGVDSAGAFLHDIRRARGSDDFFAICDRHLLAEGRAETPFACEPYPGVIARPNREAPQTCSL